MDCVVCLWWREHEQEESQHNSLKLGRLSVEESVASWDESSTTVATVPPQVVSLAPVRSSPGLNLDRGHHEDDGEDGKKHQQLEHLDDAEHTWNGIGKLF